MLVWKHFCKKVCPNLNFIINRIISLWESLLAKLIVRCSSRNGKIGYNMDILRQTACMVVNPNMADNFASIFNWTTVSRSSDNDNSLLNPFQLVGAWLSMSWLGPTVVLFVIFLFSLQIAIEPFALFHHSVFDYMCFTVMFKRWGWETLSGPNMYVVWSCIRIKDEVSRG